MTDPRITALHQRGIQGSDAITSLEAFDYALTSRRWADIKCKAQKFEQWGERLSYFTTIFGHDATRVAAVLYLHPELDESSP